MMEKTFTFRKLTDNYDFEGDPKKKWFCEIVDSNLNKQQGNPVVNYVRDGKINITCYPRQLNLEHKLKFMTAAEEALEEISKVKKALKWSISWTKALLVSFAIIGVAGIILGALAIKGIKQPDQLWEKVPTVSSVSKFVQDSSSFKTAFNTHDFYNSKISWDYTRKTGKVLQDIFQWVGKYDDKDLFVQKNLDILVNYDTAADHCEQYPLARLPKYDELTFVSQNWTAGWKIEELGGEWTEDDRWDNQKIWVDPAKLAELTSLVQRIDQSRGNQLDAIAVEIGMTSGRNKMSDSKFRDKITDTAAMNIAIKVHANSWFEDGYFWLDDDDTLQGRCVILADEDDWKDE